MPHHVLLWFSTFIHTGNISEYLLLSTDHWGWKNEGGGPLCVFSNLRDMRCVTQAIPGTGWGTGAQRGKGSVCLEAWGSVQKNTDIPWSRSLAQQRGEPYQAGRASYLYKDRQVLMKNHSSVAGTLAHGEDAWVDGLAVLKVREGTAVQPPARLGWRIHCGLYSKITNGLSLQPFFPLWPQTLEPGL